jgi:hypothetical protein
MTIGLTEPEGRGVERRSSCDVTEAVEQDHATTRVGKPATLV